MTWGLLLAVALCASGCSGGGGPSCSFKDGTQLAATTWPKFRADTANTGRACLVPATPPTPCVGIDLSGNTGMGTLLLPQSTQTPTATPTVTVTPTAAGTATATNSPGPTLTPSTPGASPPTSTETAVPSPTLTRTITPTRTPTLPDVTPATPTGTPITQIGPIETTPILGPDSRLFIASSDGNVYVIDLLGQPVGLTQNIQVDSAITGSPLVGANGVLFVPSNGLLTQYNTDGTLLNSATIGGFIAASPNIWDGDGTTFVASLGGVYAGVCPNGVPRYSLTFPQTQSSVALVQDPNDSNDAIIVAGGVNGQVRAFNIEGRQRWSFFASANITAAVLIDETTEQFYAADNSGRVFSGTLSNGQLVSTFAFEAGATIAASMALGRDDAAVYPTPRLYVADVAGIVHALNRATGEEIWAFDALQACATHCGNEQVAQTCALADSVASAQILSSPAVAVGGNDDTIVFGVDGLDADRRAVCGYVCAVTDDHTTNRPICKWSFPTSAPIGASSPSIGADGTVYIGSRGNTNGGAVYAIGP